MAQNLQRDTLRKLSTKNKNPLIPLRIEYSEKSKLLSNYINKLLNQDRIYPTHLPTQASFRWSTINPPLTNFPRECINPSCPDYEHETTEQCWSVRDILLPDDDEILVTWDHDNIEGKIHDLILNDQKAIEAHAEGLDLHTITCCDMFGMAYPTNRRNPHTLCECSKEMKQFWKDNPDQELSVDKCIHCQWRSKYKWQGKDTRRRVLAKNFNHGSKYTKTWRFVYAIKGIDKYGATHQQLGTLAKRYIATKKEVWDRKIAIMNSIQRSKIARTLYGARRKFFDSSEATGKEGFSHMISGTVSDYNNETLIMLENLLGDSIRLLHNAHDGDKIAVKKDNVPSKDELSEIIERPIEYQGRSLIMTAGIKVYD